MVSMKWFNNLNIRLKLTISFFVIFIMVFLNGIYVSFKIKEMYDSEMIVNKVKFPALLTIGEIDQLFMNYRLYELRFVFITSKDDVATITSNIDNIITNINKKTTEYKKFMVNDKEIKLFSDFEKDFQVYINKNEKIKQLFQENELEEAKRLISDPKSINESNQVYEDAKAKISKLIKFNLDAVNQSTDEADGIFVGTNSVMTILFFVIILISLVIGYITTRSILNPLKSAYNAIDSISKGDLTVHLNIEREDELGIILKKIDSMVKNLTATILNIGKVSSAIENSILDMNENSHKLASSSQDMASSSEETSASIEELTASIENVNTAMQKQAENMEEINISIHHLSDLITTGRDSTYNLAKLADDSAKNAKIGEKIINDATFAMGRIREASHRITEIVGIISDISNQTNLLSLNAAIEAARAGDAGRGFAVVADSISKLADRTVMGVKEIKSLIAETDSAVEEGNQKVTQVSDILKKVMLSIKTINQSASVVLNGVESQVENVEVISNNSTDVASLAKEIQLSTVEQKSAASEINQNSMTLSNIAFSVSTSSEKLKDISNNLNDLTLSLKKDASFFKA